MRKLHIGIIDIVSKSPRPGLWARVMNANFASIMPQVIACWCESAGHKVTLVCYTGFEDLLEEFAETPDIVFIGGFTQSAQLSYALSRLFQSRGAITALGGPHARCYPQDAQQYFDYVLGFTDKAVIQDVLQDCSQHRPIGRYVAAQQQPVTLPGVRERWKFVEATLRKAPVIKIVPMISSLGCPYTCGFCIDAAIPYQQLDIDVLREDLKFLLTKYKRACVGWHDPNFGIRFDDCLGAIEEVVPPGRIDFIAESTLGLLSEPHVKRMARSGFKALLPGIESWYDMGAKSKTGRETGLAKVEKVSDQVNMILRHIPYVQANFVLGLDSDEGPDPFALTMKFLDSSPGAFPAFSLLTSFGQAARLNLDYQRAGRVLPFPFHFLNNNHAMNVRVKNYSWPEFYDHVIDLTRYACSPRMMSKRLFANGASIPGALNLVRAMSTEGAGRIKYYSNVRQHLDGQNGFRAYFEQESTSLPELYLRQMRRDLGMFWEWLPESAIFHDPYAYLKTESVTPQTIPLNEVRITTQAAAAVAPAGALPDSRDQKA
jgi:hypothetical protein